MSTRIENNPYPTEHLLRLSRRPRDKAPEPLVGPPNCNYPASDGRPLADNTIQYDWIATIKGGLDRVFRDDPNVFVAANLMWYPVRDNNRRRLAPDAFVAFGRPKGDRTAYTQHLEADVPPTVVFEIHSPGNRKRVMDYKFRVYQQYGIEEYYYYNPYRNHLDGWIGGQGQLDKIVSTVGWTSPRLGIRFEFDESMTIVGPDGRPFVSYVEVANQRDAMEERAAQEADRAAREHARADQQAEATRQAVETMSRAQSERDEAVETMTRAQSERDEAVETMTRAQSERDEAVEAMARMVARLRARGIDPDA